MEELNNKPGVINIRREVAQNDYFRREIWTGEYLQVTVMSIPAGGEIGVELHSDLDQILKAEYGVGDVFMGEREDELRFVGRAATNDVILIPAGTWHNIINNQNRPLKLFSVYAPPKHPVGTIHRTKLDADNAEKY